MLGSAGGVGARLVTAPRGRPRVARDWAAYDHQRGRPRLKPVTVSRETFNAIEALVAAGDSRSAIVERALRRELGLPEESTGGPKAEVSRDVAWCEALRDCGYPIARVAGIALGVDGVAAASVAEAATFGEDIAAAIRAAKP